MTAKDTGLEIPTAWYSILADLPDYDPLERRPPSDLGPATDGPVRLSPQLPLTMYRQSVSRDRYVPIPGDILAQYERWRPTPLRRARDFERYLDTPARIYYKHEGVSPSGSHKLNSALAQAYYYKKAGIEELATGTGAGQWGTALAMACRIFGLGCTVFMVRCSYDQKPQRRAIMEMLGARVVPSPSPLTRSGRAVMVDDPDSPGSLSIAGSEGIQYAWEGTGRRYASGSAENHVLLHQTVIGQEAVAQMRRLGEFPDVVVAAIGAGSNFAGLAFPFHRESLDEGRDTELVAVEPKACPKLTRGRYVWDHHDASGSMPMSKMYSLGHDFVPPAIHAGGLRYHGAAPVVSWMYHQKLMSAVAYGQREVFEAGLAFARTEHVVPAPESAHAIRCVIDKAAQARKTGRDTVILFNLSGHGLMDLGAYQQYLDGTLPEDAEFDDLVPAGGER
jgi:tryptophan synthase beta chain